MTLGDQKGFPAYIPVGIVRVVTSPVAAVSHIEVFADMGKLDYVMIITYGAEEQSGERSQQIQLEALS